MRYTLAGTHKGNFMGMPATGKQINIWGIIVRRIENGQIVEDWDIVHKTINNC